MADQIGVYDCTVLNSNQGVGTCPFDIGLLERPIAIPKGMKFTEADIAVIGTYLKGKLFNDNSALRWYPHPLLKNLEDGTTEAGTETGNFGGTRMVGQDIPKWTGTYWDDMCAAINVKRGFHNRNEQYDWLWMDNTGMLFGEKTVVAGVTYVGGWSVDTIWSKMWKAPTNSNGAIYATVWGFSNSTQMYDNIVGIVTGLNPKDLKGLISVNLNKISEAADGVYNIKLETTCGRYNIGTKYNTQLDTGGMWTAFNATTGVAIPITAVTWNAALGFFAVNLDETDSNYPTVGDPIYLNLAAPSVTEGAGVGDFDAGEGYEGVRLTVLAT